MRDRLQRVLMLLMVPVLMLASSGISLVPVTAISDSRSGSQVLSEQWYPCKDHACECISAKICRSSCCCHQSLQFESNQGPAVEAGHSDDYVSFRLVIKSASCSGRDIISSTIKTIFYVVETSSISVATDSNLCPLIETTSTYMSLAISPDPPIPRSHT